MALSPPLVNTEVMLTGIDVGGRQVLIYPNWVGPEFFQTMGIPLLRGRYIRPGETHAVVLSESLARKRWPNEDPIGKQWKDGKDIVVGVVGNTRAMELNNTDATEIYYPPSADRLSGMSILVRTGGDPKAVSANIKLIAGSIDPKLFPTITPLKAGFRKSVAQVEQIATLISLLGGIAIFLAVVGLLGLVAYAVSQRTKEIAIRLAIGASRKEIVLCRVAPLRLARPGRVGRRSWHNRRALADTPSRALRYQWSGPSELPGCDRIADRNSGSRCLAADPTSVPAGYRKDSALRMRTARLVMRNALHEMTCWRYRVNPPPYIHALTVSLELVATCSTIGATARHRPHLDAQKPIRPTPG